MRKLSCHIDAPFSANNMYVPTGRGQMAKSLKYRQWLEQVVPQLKANLSPAERFPVQIEIFVLGGREWQLGQDIDNVCKPLIDALVKAEIIPDDKSKYVEFASARYLPGPTRRGGTLTQITYIEPEEATCAWGEA